MQRSIESLTRWHKASIASMLSHKGKRYACSKAHKEANTRNPNMQTNKGGKRQVASKPNIIKMYPHTWLHPNKP